MEEIGHWGYVLKAIFCVGPFLLPGHYEVNSFVPPYALHYDDLSHHRPMETSKTSKTVSQKKPFFS